MKLWVDDIRNAPDDSWHIARTAVEAIRAIARYDFDVISLDHDISHQVSIGTKLDRPFPCGETFASVAYFITERYAHMRDWEHAPDGSFEKGKSDTRPKIILHTSNQVAGDEMSEVLSQANLTVEKKYMGAANRLEMEL